VLLFVDRKKILRLRGTSFQVQNHTIWNRKGGMNVIIRTSRYCEDQDV
jgi:hypothetical protein